MNLSATIRSIGTAVLLLILTCTAVAHEDPWRQSTDNRNAWLMFFANARFCERLGLYAEVQWRRNDYFDDPQQLLLRTGLNVYSKSGLNFTAGYCFVETYPYGEFPVKTRFPENRLWQQLQIRSVLIRTEWISRFRLEQRFSKLPVPVAGLSDEYAPGESVYTNRFRIMNRLSIPFRGKEIRDRSLYFSVYDELFINFGHNVEGNIFDQNRAYAALGYVVPRLGRIELGFMEQTLLKPDGRRLENNHTLQISLFSTIDFRNRD